MHFLLAHWLLILGVVLLIPSLYFAYVCAKGWSLVKEAPRANMFICDKGHGPLPDSALIDFMGQKYCSICFHNNLKRAERGEMLR